MRIKELFTVPDGEKVTEKALGKVLISSICSILLCMVCLVSTTWAWFAVSIENSGNVIQIATVTETVTVMATDRNETVDPADGVYNLVNGKYSVQVQLNSNATGTDAFGKPMTPVYVLMSIQYDSTEDGVKYYYFSFDGGSGEAEQTLEINGRPAVLNFTVTWLKPAAAVPIGNEAITIGEATMESIEMPTTEPTTIPEDSTASAPTEPSTLPSETTTPTESD